MSSYKSPWWMSTWFTVVVILAFLGSSYLMGVLLTKALKEAAKNMPTVKVEVVQEKLTPPVVELGEATDGGKVE